MALWWIEEVSHKILQAVLLHLHDILEKIKSDEDQMSGFRGTGMGKGCEYKVAAKGSNFY